MYQLLELNQDWGRGYFMIKFCRLSRTVVL